MNNVVYKYIVKYSLMLGACSLLVYTADLALQYIPDNPDLTNNDLYMINSIPSLLTYFLNLVVAFMLYVDIRKLNLPTRYVIVATIFFRPVGVCAFLLYLIYEKNK